MASRSHKLPNLVTAHKKKKTHSAYRTALTYFLESCKKQTLEEIHRTDMLAFKTYLRDKKKQSDRSIANKFENVMSFLKQQKITGLIGKNDRPTFTEEEVETYTQDELDKFFAVCRVVRGMRRVRIGAVGARPNAFNTTRYSEKLLELAGISVNTIDLSEVFGSAARIADTDARVKQRVDEIRGYADSQSAPAESLIKMAKFALVVDDWMMSLGLTATAIQCWSSMQKNYGVNTCTIMSMMSKNMMPSACEVDIAGVVSMYALQLASQRPSALVDWNNNYGDDPDKCVLFHCGNWAKDFLPDIRIGTAPILGTMLGEENTVGALEGRTPSGPMTFGRVSTDDISGKLRAYVGNAYFTDDPLNTFGTRAVAKISRLRELMHYICLNGFEHHAAMNGSHCAAPVAEALGTYLGWDVYLHSSERN